MKKGLRLSNHLLLQGSIPTAGTIDLMKKGLRLIEAAECLFVNLGRNH